MTNEELTAMTYDLTDGADLWIPPIGKDHPPHMLERRWCARACSPGRVVACCYGPTAEVAKERLTQALANLPAT